VKQCTPDYKGAVSEWGSVDSLATNASMGSDSSDVASVLLWKSIPAAVAICTSVKLR
jgi:hypothetical protein